MQKTAIRPATNGRCVGVIVLLVMLVSGCGGDTTQALLALPTAAQISEQQAAGVDVTLDWQGESVAALAQHGERLWSQCRTCHQLGSDAANGAGPALTGIVGRPAGRAAGFAYSTAMREAQFVWSQSALDAWLARPWRFLPGTSMQYGGLSNAEDRLALIAYLSESDQ
ncbi:MAG: c-type cytochrome [Pseudomonadota bacterium]